MTWIYNNEAVNEIDPLYVGFIYCITNRLDGRKYYGKKKLLFKKTALKTVTLKSGVKKKKKIRSEVPSDWETYYGSSDELKKDVAELGMQNFDREIVKFCKTLSEMSYEEARIQFVTDCLLHPDKFYNSWISVRVRRAHLVKSV
jgi:hypothetical protein